MKMRTFRLAGAAALSMTLGSGARVLALSAPRSPPLAPQSVREERTSEIPITPAPGVPHWYAVNGAATSPAAPANGDRTTVVPARSVPRWYAVN